MAPTFEEIKAAADSPSLIYKALEGVAFLAPEDASAIDALTDATGALVAIPTEYKAVGMVSTDGYTFGRDTETSEVTALGYSSPVRTDVTAATRTVSFTTLESTKRTVLELVYGMDLSTVEQGSNGEITFDHPDRPQKRYYRLLIIGADGAPDKRFYRGKFLPKVSVTEYPEETWNQDDPVQYEVTLTAEVDDTLGTGERDFIAGPGALAASSAMGFTQAPTGP